MPPPPTDSFSPRATTDDNPLGRRSCHLVRGSLGSPGERARRLLGSPPGRCAGPNCWGQHRGQDGGMGKVRVAAFSDGVLAVAITLLVLDLTSMLALGTAAWPVNSVKGGRRSPPCGEPSAYRCHLGQPSRAARSGGAGRSGSAVPEPATADVVTTLPFDTSTPAQFVRRGSDARLGSRVVRRVQRLHGGRLHAHVAPDGRTRIACHSQQQRVGQALHARWRWWRPTRIRGGGSPHGSWSFAVLFVVDDLDGVTSRGSGSAALG